VEAEVLAGNYTIRAMAFGKYFTQNVTLDAGQSQVAVVRVPNAKLRIAVVDYSGRPIDEHVTSV